MNGINCRLRDLLVSATNRWLCWLGFHDWRPYSSRLDNVKTCRRCNGFNPISEWVGAANIAPPYDE